MKSKVYLSSAFLAFCLLATSCAKIYYHPDATTIAESHEVLAIMPPVVSISARKKVDAESLIEQQKTESINFQKEIYAWLLKRKMKNQFICDFQETDNTNALLARAGYPDTLLTTDEICSLLGVDGVIKTNIALSKPMSDGAAIAVFLLVGASGSTNEVRVNYNINDCEMQQLIFSFDHKYSGGLGSTTSRLVDAMMRQISKKMPHFKP